MQIGSSPIPAAGGIAGAPAAASSADRSVEAATDSLARTVAGYYEHLEGKTPVYAKITERGTVHRALECDIQSQLGALADKIKFLLTQAGSHSSQACAAQLDSFMDHILHRGEPGKLSTEQAHYFYSEAFKGSLERNVAHADMAAPAERQAAIQWLEGLCHLMSTPVSFFNQVVGAALIGEYAENLKRSIERESGPDLRGGGQPGKLPEGAARI
jgi:hypothetical protein